MKFDFLKYFISFSVNIARNVWIQIHPHQPALFIYYSFYHYSLIILVSTQFVLKFFFSVSRLFGLADSKNVNWCSYRLFAKLWQEITFLIYMVISHVVLLYSKWTKHEKSEIFFVQKYTNENYLRCLPKNFSSKPNNIAGQFCYSTLHTIFDMTFL